MDLKHTADCLGLCWDNLNANEHDRLLIVETLKPNWPRADKVKFTRIGGENLIEGDGMDPKYRSLNMNRVKLQLGFSQAATTLEHDELFGEIVDALPESCCHARPLSDPGISANQLEKVRALVAELPHTNQVTQFLAATVDGPVVHAI